MVAVFQIRHGDGELSHWLPISRLNTYVPSLSDLDLAMIDRWLEQDDELREMIIKTRNNREFTIRKLR